MTAWARFWLSIGAVAVAAELVALIRKQPGDTLSEQVWAWLHVTPGKTPMRAALLSWRSFVVAAFLLWLVAHFVLGWWY